jgi:hypothetical protein
MNSVRVKFKRDVPQPFTLAFDEDIDGRQGLFVGMTSDDIYRTIAVLQDALRMTDAGHVRASASPSSRQEPTMPRDEIVEAMARAAAEFTGYVWDGLSITTRERHLDQAESALAALIEACPAEGESGMSRYVARSIGCGNWRVYDRETGKQLPFTPVYRGTHNPELWEDQCTAAAAMLNQMVDAGHLAPEGSVAVPREALTEAMSLLSNATRYPVTGNEADCIHEYVLPAFRAALTTKGTDDATG